MSWVAVGVTVVGTAASAYSAYSASKGSGQSMPSSTTQLGDARAYAQAQERLNERQAQRALELYPQFVDAQMSAALHYYPRFAASERKETTKTRDTDLSDFTRNAPGWGDALGQLSPAYSAMGKEAKGSAGSPLLDYLNMQAFDAGPSDLRRELTKQALYDLSFGGTLTPEEERMAQQSSRAAYSARGLVNSNPAITAEVLNRDYLSRERLRERMQMGINAQQVGQSEDSANRSFATGVQAQNEAAQGNWRNYLINASQAQINPVLQAGMQRTPVSPIATANAMPSPYGVSSVYAGAPQIAAGVNAVQPLYMTDFAAAESRANASANAWGAVGGGLTKTGGSLYASSLY